VLGTIRSIGSINPMESVHIDLGSTALAGELYAPAGSRGIVLFGHGDAAERRSLRAGLITRVLHWAGYATLVVDLVTNAKAGADEPPPSSRLNLEWLATRLAATTDWLQRDRRTESLTVGYFGVGLGAGAALMAAARRPALVGAIVAGGGRTDLAGEAIRHVRAPTLLVVGEGDAALAAINREDAKRMLVPSRLELVPQVTQIFEEPGAIDRLAKLAAEWFQARLAPPSLSRMTVSPAA
jgi:putative phosphoribosyl transferase